MYHANEQLREIYSSADRRRNSNMDENIYPEFIGIAEYGSENGGSEYNISEVSDELPFPGFVPISMGCMDQESKFRNICLRMITNPWFERLSIMVIIFNCVTLGMYQPCMDEQCLHHRCRLMQILDDVIFGFFTIEMLIKMVAMGIYGHGTYLADSWNRLDMFIVLAGCLEYCADVVNLSAIRTIRVLRPLRAINRIPSMRILVMLLLDTLPMLGNVLLLCFFVFFIFGIVGVQLWSGTLRQRCFLNITGENIKAPVPLASYYRYQDAEKDFICSKEEDNGMHRCEDIPPYVYHDLICNGTVESNSDNAPTETSCVNWNHYYNSCMPSDTNPFQGAISFDNIGLAWVAIFLVISLEGWTDVMYYVQDAHSFWDWIYFVLLIVIGSFFMINLCLVVIATQFSETKKREMERMKLERARFHSTSTLASTNTSEPASCYAQIVKYIAHLWRRAKRKWARYRKQRKQKKNGGKERVPRSFSLQRNKRRRTNNPNVPLGIGGVTTAPTSSNVETGVMNNNKSANGHQEVVSKHSDTTTSSSNNTSSLLNNNDSFGNNSIVSSPPLSIQSHAPRASPEISDIDPISSPRKPILLLKVPTTLPSPVGSTGGEITSSSAAYLQPLTPESQRRRSSVMFSDVVLLHDGSSSEAVNVCSHERTTQTEFEDSIPTIVTKQRRQQILQELSSATTSRPRSFSFAFFQRPKKTITSSPLTCPELLALTGALNATLPTNLTPDVAEKLQLSAATLSNEEQQPITSCQVSPEEEANISGSEYDDDDMEWSDYEEDIPKTPSCCVKLWNMFRKSIKQLVEHKYFQQGILFAILINTLSMGIEYHNQPEELTAIVETSNVVFSAIFAVEMLLKLLAYGLFGYLSNGFNVFDGVIVVLSAVEVSQSLAGGDTSSGNSSLSVLRTFRLLRILKLVRFLPNLRRQLLVMLRTMDNVAVFFALLVLFIFIFSVLGMYLFGGKFCMKADGSASCKCAEIMDPHTKCLCDRKHFNNFLWATVTVFQILTQEDWNVVLFNGMDRTSHWAALYFVALMTFGNYVLFNLLVAILVEGFSAERNERLEREQRELAKQQREKEKQAALSAENNDNQETNDANPPGGCESDHNSNSDDEPKSKPNPEPLGTYGYDDEGEPKCNIEKETKMLQQPNRVDGLPLCLPPVITHTAATPQGSPHANVDTPLREWVGARLVPSMALYASCGSSIDSIDKSISSQCSSPRLHRTGSDYSSSRVYMDSGAGLIGRRRSSLLSPAQSRRRDSLLAPNTQYSPGGTPLYRRRSRSSWKGLKQSLRGTEGSGSDGDGEEDTILNNGQSARIVVSGEHRHCNGGVPRTGINVSTTTNTPNNQRPTAVCQSPRTLSPQNSIRSQASAPRSPLAIAFAQLPWTTPQQIGTTIRNPVSRHNSVCSHHPSLTPQNPVPSRQNSINEFPFKANNLTADVEIQRENEDKTSKDDIDMSQGLKRLWTRIIEPPACLNGREDYSLYLFSPDNSFRQLCQWTVERSWFDHIVLLFIGLNCITLAMERPKIPPISLERSFLSASNYVFTIVFALEMFIKVVATGMFHGEGAYFTSGWNVMDGSLVTISIIDFLMSLMSEGSPRIFGILRVFRLLRSLRPLRVINRAPGLKLVVQTLLSSLRPIGNIVLICCTFFIIFGILGVQLFKGMFYFCEGPDIKHITNKSECIQDKHNKWINRKYNFDDLGQALMSLFVLSSKDGWVNIMYSGLDAVGVDQQPQENHSEWRLLYFISFLLLVGFFVLNMFVGVVVENFHRCREEQEREEKARRAEKRAKKMAKKRRSEQTGQPPSPDTGSDAELDENERKLAKMRARRRREMHEPPYYINYSKPRLFLHSMVASKYFDLAIAAVIGLNVVTMAMEFYRMPKELEYTLDVFNYFFTAVFVLELMMKLAALGIKRYLKDKWNQLDVFIVMLSMVGIVFEEMKSKVIPINPTIIRVMRVLRIARVLKLLKMAKGIRALLDTVMQALPQVGNLGLLFFLLFFIFAALGVELFGRLECSDNFPCQGLSEHAHFGNFGIAFLTLFRVATGDNWNGIMKDTLRDTCDHSNDCLTNCCVSTVIAPIFFVIFVLMAQFVLVNVVVAVLMKHLEESHKQMEDELDMEAELEQELAAEEALAELQDQWSDAVKAIEAATESELEMTAWGHRPLGKMNSLPANFTFPSSTKPANGNSNREFPASVCGGSARGSLVVPLIPLMTPVTCAEINNLADQNGGTHTKSNSINIRQPSPDESDDKVAVADLRQMPPILIRVGSFPDITQVTPEENTFSSNLLGYHSLPGSQCHLDSAEDDISPDCTSAAVTLVPPSYPAQSFPSSPDNPTLPQYNQIEILPQITLDIPSPPMSPMTVLSSTISSPQSQHQLIVTDTDSSDT